MSDRTAKRRAKAQLEARSRTARGLPPQDAAEPAAGPQAATQAPEGGQDQAPKLPEDLPPEIRARLEAAMPPGAGAGGEKGGAAGDASAAAAALLGAGKPSRRPKKYTVLERELAVILTLPAAPFDHAGDAYCAMHFAIQGPALSAHLTRYAESHEATYRLLVQLIEAGGILTLSLAVFSYALPPMMHHGAPAPGWLKSIYQVPERPPKPEPVPDAERAKAA